MKLAVVGVGLIGGCMAIDLFQRGFVEEVIGIDKNEKHLELAKSIGFIHKGLSLEEGISEADLIVLAIPVNQCVPLLLRILDLVKPHQIVIDVGSTKNNICQAVENHANRARFVATHPMAGTENSGPTAAFSGLFDRKINVICQPHKSDSDALETVIRLYQTLQMQLHFMEPDEHDLHIAYVSHLSHISSFMLGRTVLQIEKDEKHIFTMASTGFASTVRLAKSSPEMWAAIFEQNRENVSQALDEYIKQLVEFKQLIDESNTDELRGRMREANDIRRVLDGIELKTKQK